MGEPWIILTGATFYQDSVNDSNPPNPILFDYFPDSEYTSFYTTHTAWPNTDSVLGPGFAHGPADAPRALNADWFCVPDGNDYPGTVTIARFTIIPERADWCADIDMLISSDDVYAYRFKPIMEGCCPGDFDGDGDVDLADLAQLLAHYGTTSGATYSDADMDGDDDVDPADLTELLSLYGTDCW